MPYTYKHIYTSLQVLSQGDSENHKKVEIRNDTICFDTENNKVELSRSQSLVFARNLVYFAKYSPLTRPGHQENLCQDAKETLKILTNQINEKAIVYFFLGEIASVNGRWKDALSHYNTAKNSIDGVTTEISQSYDKLATMLTAVQCFQSTQEIFKQIPKEIEIMEERIRREEGKHEDVKQTIPSLLNAARSSSDNVQTVVACIRGILKLASKEDVLKYQMLLFIYGVKPEASHFEFDSADALPKLAAQIESFDKRLKLADLIGALYDIYFWLSENKGHGWFSNDKQTRREDFMEMLHRINLGMLKNNDDFTAWLRATANSRELQKGIKSRYYNVRNAFYLKVLEHNAFNLVKLACNFFLSYIDTQSLADRNSFAAELKSKTIIFCTSLKPYNSDRSVPVNNHHESSAQVEPFLQPILVGESSTVTVPTTFSINRSGSFEDKNDREFPLSPKTSPRNK